MPAKKSRAGVLLFLAVCVFNYLTDASQLESDVKYALPSPLESNVEFQSEEKREELDYADFSTDKSFWSWTEPHDQPPLANQFPIYPFPDGISATPPTLPFNVRPNVNFRSMNDREMKRFRTAWPQSMHDSYEIEPNDEDLIRSQSAPMLCDEVDRKDVELNDAIVSRNTF
eukprot:47617_1